MAKKDREQLYPVHGPKNIPEMTDEEVKEYLEDGYDTVLIGLGSCESHAGHIPLGCDAFQVDEFCRRAVHKLSKEGYKALAGPVVPFGMSVYYTDIPGTCSVSADTLVALIKEICFCLIGQGFSKVALVLGHGGNFFPMMNAAQEIVDETDAQVLAINWVPAMGQRISEFSKSTGPDGHAGEVNTSNMMAVIPELVQMDRAPEPYFPSVEEGMPASSQIIGEGLIDDPDIPPLAYSPLTGGGVFMPLKDYRAETDGVGMVGDPTLATPETGEKAIEVITEWIKDVVLANWKR